MLAKLKQYDSIYYINIGFWCMFILQVIILAFFNLTQMQYHMGYDASSYYLKAMEMAKQGTLFIKNWVDQTTLYFDSPVPFAALIYSVTGNIFVSYGIVNFLCDLVIFYLFYSILDSCGISAVSKAVCMNMAACSYISPAFNNVNDMGYFSSVLSSADWYGLKVIIILMVIRMFIDLDAGRVNYIYIIAAEALLFISGVSSGWYILVTIIIPLMAYYMIRMFLYNSYKEVLHLRMLLLVVSVIVIGAGKFFAVNVIGYVSRDSDMILIGHDLFWKNLGSVVLGFMELVGAFPSTSDVQAIGADGFIYLMGTCVFCICVIGIVYAVRRLCKNGREAFCRYGMLACTVGVNILMFAVLQTTYGAAVFEIRYLIPIFFAVIAFVGLFIDSLENSLIVKKFVLAGMFISYLLLNLYDNRLFYTNRNNYDILKAVTEEINSLNVPVVYLCGDSLGIDARNIRVIDEQKIYKGLSGAYDSISHWGDYTYYDDAADAYGKNVMITTDDDYGSIPEYIKNNYILYTKIDKYGIYVAETNKFDFRCGIEGEYGLDYPFSPGVSAQDGKLDEGSGSFICDGTVEGNAVLSPPMGIKKGSYEFILNYEILECSGQTAEFVISLDCGNHILGSAVLEKDQQQVSVKVDLAEDVAGLEYKIYNYKGNRMKIHSFEIICNR